MKSIARFKHRRNDITFFFRIYKWYFLWNTWHVSYTCGQKIWSVKHVSPTSLSRILWALLSRVCIFNYLTDQSGWFSALFLNSKPQEFDLCHFLHDTVPLSPFPNTFTEQRDTVSQIRPKNKYVFL